jgi:hypothetical protein
LFTAAAAYTVALRSQLRAAEEAAGGDDRFDWWGDIDGFLNRQAEIALEMAGEVLQAFTPQIPEPAERRRAMMLLDQVFHDPDAPKRPAVQRFLHSRLERAAGLIESTRVETGAMVWKLYNHGFVVRTPTVTIGFDLVRAHSARAEGFAVADEVLLRIARECDALFISHRHGDHADPTVAGMFLSDGKPVVAPPEVWADQAIHPKITHLNREPHTLQPLPIQDGKLSLRVAVYPGHQGGGRQSAHGNGIENNVPLVFTPEGMSFAQTGDQSNDEDFSWIDQVGQRHRVDVLMPNCWTPDIVRMVRGFDPELILSGHENEMGHTIDHREPYWLTYSRLRGATAPLLVLAWGESFHYQPKS